MKIKSILLEIRYEYLDISDLLSRRRQPKILNYAVITFWSSLLPLVALRLVLFLSTSTADISAIKKHRMKEVRATNIIQSCVGRVLEKEVINYDVMLK